MKSHQLQTQTVVNISQQFYPYSTPPTQAAPPKLNLWQQFLDLPETANALHKLRRLAFGKDLTESELLTVVVYLGLAHIEALEHHNYADWKYCAAEGLELKDYWLALMRAKPTRKKRK